MQNNTYILIMAGGVGSRFWPKSRHNFPKQFIDILGTGKSLLQLTYERFLRVCLNEQIYILTNEGYVDLVKTQLPNIVAENILSEPSRNNTAPCIAYAAYKIAELNPLANIVVAPSDHLILKETEFLDKIQLALNFTSSNNALVTLGISPTRPDTGYGYIKFEINADEEIQKVSAFLEKPSLEKATEYLESGDFVWNAGIFIWSSKSLIMAFEKYANEIALIFEKGKVFYNTLAEKEFIKTNYPTSPNISIDYAILEKATNVYTIPSDIGWSDLGTWASLHSIADKDEHNNVVNCIHFNLKETANCLIDLPPNKAAVIRGLEDFIVVDDDQVLLIYPKSKEQEIKQVSKDLTEIFGSHFG